VLSKNQGREHKHIGVIVLPSLARQSGLDAGLLNERVPVPVFLDRHLRQQQSLDISLLNNQPVLADFDLFDIQNPPDR
jgi:hypothetical protein